MLMAEALLFDAFHPDTREAWERRILAGLKGASSLDALRWQPEEGITLEPFYLRDEAPVLPVPPGAPRTRIIQELPLSDETPGHARDALKDGADAVYLHVPASGLTEHRPLLEKLAAGADTPGALIIALDGPFVDQDSGWVKEVGTGMTTAFDPYPLPGAPLHPAPWPTLAKAPASTAEIHLNGAALFEAGATVSQTVGSLLAALREALSVLDEEGLPPAGALPRLRMLVPVGVEFLPSLAGIRALRLGVSMVQAALGLPLRSVPLLACPARRYESTCDPYVNQIRQTTETATALITGCDGILVHPFDAVSRPLSAEALRLARHTALILEHEGHLTGRPDGASGAYHIEVLTDRIARKGWAFFQQIEAMGGYEAALSSGFLAEAIAREREREETAVRDGSRVLVGVNRYPSPEPTAPGVPPDPGYRAARSFEALVARSLVFEARHGRRPRALLLPYGPSILRARLSTLATNLLRCAGLEVVEAAGKDSLPAHTTAQPGLTADLLVLCGPSPDPGALESLRGTFSTPPPLTLIATLEAASVEETFDGILHPEAPQYDTLEALLTRLGV